MRVVLLASASERVRRESAAQLLAIPGRTVLRYERVGGGLVRDAQGRGVRAAEVIEVLAHDSSLDVGDLSSLVAHDVPRALSLLDGPGVDQLVVALPAGMRLATVVAALTGAGRLAQLHAIAVAVDPGALWPALHSSPRGSIGTELMLAEDYVDTNALIANLLWADTITLVEGVRSPGGIGCAVGLLTHLAPCARIMHLACRRFSWNGFDHVESSSRTRAGALSVPLELESVDGMTTAVFTAPHPLDEERVRQRLTALASRSVFSRGTVWLSSEPERRIAWWGVGSVISFADAGPWLCAQAPPGPGVPSQVALAWRPGLGDRGTSLAFTGQDLDPGALWALLTECLAQAQSQSVDPSMADNEPMPTCSNTACTTKAAPGDL
ncbi:MAG: GTP-binding protein [Sporichthyaceae bacterium]